jgi:hypothetical protein
MRLLRYTCQSADLHAKIAAPCQNSGTVLGRTGKKLPKNLAYDSLIFS